MTESADNGPPNIERQRFLHACTNLLGHVYAFPGGDRALALGALAAALAKTPPDAPLDQALRAFVVAIEPLVGAPDASSVRMTAEDLRPVKRKTLEHALSLGSSIVVIDASHPNVELPPGLLGVRDLKLRFGYDLDPPIPDLKVTDAGVSGTLHFRGVPFLCVVPWDAIWAVGSEVTHEGCGWPQSAPQGYDANGTRPKDAPDVRLPGDKPRLGVIEGGLEDEPAEQHASTEDVDAIKRTLAAVGPVEGGMFKARAEPVQDAPPVRLADCHTNWPADPPSGAV